MGAGSNHNGRLAIGVALGLAACGLTERSRESSGARESDTSTQGTGGDQTEGGGAGRSSEGAPESFWQQQAELPEVGAMVADFATGAVSLHDGTAALGTFGEVGEVQVFAEHGAAWLQEPLFLGPDTLGRAGGASVVVFEDTLLVGAPSEGAGLVYVFEREEGTWTEANPLQASDGVEGDGFGSSVALSGATALVGTWNGTVHGFTRAGGAWSEEQRLTLDAGDGVEFAGALALDGDTAVIGTRDGNAVSAAHVFVREATGWEQEQPLVPEHTSSGVALALSGDTALLGTPEDRALAGAVHVFSREGSAWSERQLLVGDENAEYFGSDVAIHRNVALVASREIGGYAGSVYVFERTDLEWSMVQELVSPRAYADGFGSSMAVFGDTALIAAPGQGELDQWFGSAYLFTRVVER